MQLENNQKKILTLEIIGLIFTLTMSFILHFLYEWSGESKIIAMFSATNESVWEHGKLLFIPFIFYSIVEYFILRPKNIGSYLTAKAVPLISCIPLMIAIFYTYTGVIGYNVGWVDITMSIGIVLWMNIYSFYTLINEKYKKGSIFLLIIVLIILILIIVFTYFPPNLPLFLDITTGKYGIL